MLAVPFKTLQHESASGSRGLGRPLKPRRFGGNPGRGRIERERNSFGVSIPGERSGRPPLLVALSPDIFQTRNFDPSCADSMGSSGRLPACGSAGPELSAGWRFYKAGPLLLPSGRTPHSADFQQNGLQRTCASFWLEIESWRIELIFSWLRMSLEVHRVGPFYGSITARMIHRLLAALHRRGSRDLVASAERCEARTRFEH